LFDDFEHYETMGHMAQPNEIGTTRLVVILVAGIGYIAACLVVGLTWVDQSTFAG
jgi:hypothetical protein